MPSKNYKVPSGGRKVPLTIRQMEALRKENLKKTRQELLEFELDVLTTPKKPLKSVPKLKKALSDFFEDHQEDPYVTMNQLAKAIGYADEDSMVKDTFSINNNPQYNLLVKKAISVIEDLMTRRMLAISDAAGDTKGYQFALQRMDKKRDKYDPDSKVEETQTQVRVNIQMQENEAVKNVLDNRLASLLSAQRGKAVDITPKQIPSKIRTPETIAVPVTAEEVQNG